MRSAAIHARLRYKGNLCISGLTAAGKTTHSHLLAGEFGLTYISGSQIQLNQLGVSPIQSREFWVTQEAQALWNADQFNRIDQELVRPEAGRNGCVFDTSTMPWRHRREALCVWLESDLASRTKKAIVSHHGNGGIAIEKYPDLIASKDKATRSLYEQLYGIRIGDDLKPFDLVLDISEAIAHPSLEASLRSIRDVHAIIRPAAAYYLTGRSSFRRLFDLNARRLEKYVLVNEVEVARNRLLAHSDG